MLSILFNLGLVQMGLGFPAPDPLTSFMVNRGPNLLFIALQVPLLLGPTPNMSGPQLERGRGSVGKPVHVTQKWASRFFSLPSTSTGKWSARLLLLSFALVLLNVLVVLPATEQRTGLELPQAIFNLFILLCLASAGIAGLIALVMRREGSWAVLASVLVAVLVVGFELAGLIIHK